MQPEERGKGLSSAWYFLPWARDAEIERLQAKIEQKSADLTVLALRISERDAEIERLTAARDAYMRVHRIDRDEVWNLFCDHYWDSFQKDRDLILCHVDTVLKMARAALEPKPSGPERAP